MPQSKNFNEYTEWPIKGSKLLYLHAGVELPGSVARKKIINKWYG